MVGTKYLTEKEKGGSDWSVITKSASFTIRASRKRLKRMREIAAYKVRQWLSSDSDIEHLNLPQILDILVKKIINTYSGDYIIIQMKAEIKCI